VASAPAGSITDRVSSKMSLIAAHAGRWSRARPVHGRRAMANVPATSRTATPSAKIPRDEADADPACSDRYIASASNPSTPITFTSGRSVLM
jgi:hypothetical protein